MSLLTNRELFQRNTEERDYFSSNFIYLFLWARACGGQRVIVRSRFFPSTFMLMCVLWTQDITLYTASSLPLCHLLAQDRDSSLRIVKVDSHGLTIRSQLVCGMSFFFKLAKVETMEESCLQACSLWLSELPFCYSSGPLA